MDPGWIFRRQSYAFTRNTSSPASWRSTCPAAGRAFPFLRRAGPPCQRSHLSRNPQIQKNRGRPVGSRRSRKTENDLQASKTGGQSSRPPAYPFRILFLPRLTRTVCSCQSGDGFIKPIRGFNSHTSESHPRYPAARSPAPGGDTRQIVFFNQRRFQGDGLFLLKPYLVGLPSAVYSA